MTGLIAIEFTGQNRFWDSVYRFHLDINWCQVQSLCLDLITSTSEEQLEGNSGLGPTNVQNGYYPEASYNQNIRYIPVISFRFVK